jgi:hypothetical protein
MGNLVVLKTFASIDLGLQPYANIVLVSGLQNYSNIGKGLA